MINSGDSYTGVLAFAEPASAAGRVTLSSFAQGVTLRDASVSVAAGAKEVGFTVDTRESTLASSATITAAGAATGALTLNLEPSLPAQFSAVQTQLKQLGLPVGWVRVSTTKAERANRQEIPGGLASAWDSFCFHLLGWLITALAATLGAPFWFDMLNRIMSIRSAGKAPEEKPKPPKDVPTPLEPGQTPQQADMASAGKRG